MYLGLLWFDSSQTILDHISILMIHWINEYKDRFMTVILAYLLLLTSSLIEFSQRTFANIKCYIYWIISWFLYNYQKYLFTSFMLSSFSPIINIIYFLQLDIKFTKVIWKYIADSCVIISALIGPFIDETLCYFLLGRTNAKQESNTTTLTSLLQNVKKVASQTRYFSRTY